MMAANAARSASGLRRAAAFVLLIVAAPAAATRKLFAAECEAQARQQTHPPNFRTSGLKSRLKLSLAILPARGSLGLE